jgi:microcystin-dependent protein
MSKLTTNISWKLAVMTVITISAMSLSSPVGACGTSPYLGEICTFASNYCPANYLPADGRTLQISQNTALFSLLGTTYGGNGTTTFALPDLRGRSPVGTGQGSGLSTIDVGQTGGSEEVTLSTDQMPSHSHDATTNVNVTATLRGTSSLSNSTTPTGNVLGRQRNNTKTYDTGQANTNMGASSISTVAVATTLVDAAGGSQPIDIRSPYLGLTICIAVAGVYPSPP